MTAMPTVSTLIGSDKGGVGKSFVSQLLVQAYDRVNRPLKVIEIDHQRKLTSVLGKRVNLSINATPPIAANRDDVDASERFYNQVYMKWTEGESLTDLGANVTTSLLEWARLHDIATLAEEEGVQFRFVAMATPDDQALRSAAHALEDARRSLGETAELFLLLNRTAPGSGYEPYKGTAEWRHLERLGDTHRVTTCEMPLCDSRLLEYGRSHNMTVIDILKNENGEVSRLAAAMGLDRIILRTHFQRLTAWTREFQEAVRPLLTPPKASYSLAAAE